VVSGDGKSATRAAGDRAADDVRERSVMLQEIEIRGRKIL